MGDIKRKQKKFRRPKRPFDKARIDSENVLRKKFGLKNKKEIWKADAEIKKIRKRAKDLISETGEEREMFFIKLNKIGLDVKSIEDVLALTSEDWLKRRLQTFLFNKKFANSVRMARQLISHKQVLVDGKIINKPSFIVTIALEKKIKIKPKKKKIIKNKENKSEDKK